MKDLGVTSSQGEVDTQHPVPAAEVDELSGAAYDNESVEEVTSAHSRAVEEHSGR